VQYPLLK